MEGFFLSNQSEATAILAKWKKSWVEVKLGNKAFKKKGFDLPPSVVGLLRKPTYRFISNTDQLQ